MNKRERLRILFLHASWHDTSEYEVHRLLAANVDPENVDCHFFWQEHASDPQRQAMLQTQLSDHTIEFWDFGRDMALEPRPSKLKRAAMMAQKAPGFLFQLQAYINRIKPDLIYTSQQSYEVLLAHLLTKHNRLNHVIHISYPVGPWLGRTTLQIIKRTPNLIACSDFVRRTALTADIPADNIVTLHHGADLEKYDVGRDRLALREEFGWPLSTPVVVTAARLDPGKGHMVLLEAFAKVLAELPDARLVVCGTGTTGRGYSDLVHARAEDLEITHAVEFVGRRSDLPRVFSSADVFCLPTEEDALPLVFLSAMAAGLPVVGCQSGGIPELIVHGKTGFVTEPGDADAIAAYITLLLRDMNLRVRVASAGRQYALTAHDPKHVASRWVEILHSMSTKERTGFKIHSQHASSTW